MSIKRVGIVGIGLMGSGIAQISAENGYDVVVRELEQSLLDKGFAVIERNLDRAISKGKIDVAFKDQVMGRLKGTLDYEDLTDCDLVVEAVVEDIKVKNEMFSLLDKICKPETIFATNTSSLRVSEMAAVTSRPEKMVGLHFFNPVQVMNLVEIVRTIITSEETFDDVFSFCKSIKKAPIVAKDTPGFIVNRLLAPYFTEAVRALETGVASVEDIDTRMMLGAGYPMGPLTLLDFVGIDTVYRALSSMYEEFRQFQFAPPPLMRKMVLLGLLGRKTGKGFYDYTVDPPQINDLNI